MLLKFLIVAVVIFAAYKLFANDFGKKRKQNEQKNKKATEQKAASGALVKDPVCGTYVSVEDSISVKDGSTIHYFCGYECRDAFLKQLEQGGREIPHQTSGEDED